MPASSCHDILHPPDARANVTRTRTRAHARANAHPPCTRQAQTSKSNLPHSNLDNEGQRNTFIVVAMSSVPHTHHDNRSRRKASSSLPDARHPSHTDILYSSSPDTPAFPHSLSHCFIHSHIPAFPHSHPHSLIPIYSACKRTGHWVR